MVMSDSSVEAIHGLFVFWVCMALLGLLGIVWLIEFAWMLLNSCILVQFLNFLCFFSRLISCSMCEGIGGSFLVVGMM